VTPYQAAREGAATAALPGRGLLAVSGPLRQKFLDDILSNDVKSLAAGEGRRAALMDVKGRLVAFLRAMADKDEILLEVAGGRRDLVHERLEHYRVAAPVRFARREGTAIAVLGPRAVEVLRAAGADAAELRPEGHRMTSVAGAPVRIVRAGDLPADGYALYADPGAAVEEALRAAGAVPLPAEVLDVLRVEDGRPWYGSDVGEDNLLHETGLLAEYHSPTKGCYVGQEVVARLEGRGAKVNKMVRGLRLESPVAAGAGISAAGKEVGRVTTAGVSPALGAIAMGSVHRTAAEPGTEVQVDGVRGLVARLPLRDAPR
jgi:folate-binding protein YgfZ